MAVVREFNGERFYLKRSGHYLNPKGALHRRVWESYNGPIPAGMFVHHIDHDPANNEIENLTLMEHSAHARLHASHPDLRPSLLVRISRAREVGNIIDVPVNCENCGKLTFGARKSAGPNQIRRKRFCSRKCCSQADYKRRLTKKD